MKSHAIKGLNPAKFINPFYDTARRFVGLSPATVDEFLGLHAVAALNNNVLTLTAGERVHTASVRSFHRGKVAGWVNKFNARSAG